MRTLSTNEIEAVNGGTFNLLGNLLVGSVAGINNLFNTSLVSAPGEFISKLGPLGKAIHFFPDAITYVGLKAVAGLGYALGGKGKITYHFEKEKSSGQYC